MDIYAKIEKRYGFTVPKLYRTLKAEGHLDLPWENYLSFCDCEWLSLEAIAEYSFTDWQIAKDGGFVPCLISGRHDEWCWRLDWASGAEPAIVLCERGEPEGLGYAPDLRGFLYRRALEEFAGNNDLGEEGKFDDLQRAVAIIIPHLPGPWAKRLKKLAKVELDDWQKDKHGSLCVVPRSEVDAIIAADLAFPHLNEKFVQDKEYSKRFKK